MNFKSIFTLFIVLQFSLVGSAQKFEKQTVLTDVAFLRTSLEETHYDLYAYTSQKEFDENYHKIKASIQKDSLSQHEVISLFQKVISKANTAHATIDFPIASYRAYASNNGTVFPIEIAFEDGSAFIRKNFSAHQEIPIGAEILEINDIPVQEILHTMYPQLSAETTYFKNAMLELISFPRLYWQVYGKQDLFAITIKNNNQIITYDVASISLIDDFEMKRTNIITCLLYTSPSPRDS